MPAAAAMLMPKPSAIAVVMRVIADRSLAVSIRIGLQSS
jgi:hypothetical protein